MTEKDEFAFANHLESVRIKKPSDVIIEQFTNLITSGVLKPGQRLPPERVLAERFQVGRAHVREALQKLELYGVVNTRPQSGTYVDQIGLGTLEHLIGSVLGMDELTSTMLMEVRGELEVLATRIAAERASNAQLSAIRTAFEEQAKLTATDEDTLEADSIFHIRIAEASNNVLLRSLVNLMRKDFMRIAKKHISIENSRPLEAVQEHQSILDGLIARDPESAAEAMRYHIKKSSDYYM